MGYKCHFVLTPVYELEFLLVSVFCLCVDSAHVYRLSNRLEEEEINLSG